MTTRSGALQLGNAEDGFYTQEEIDEAFPNVDPGFAPLGSRIIVQIRSVKEKTKGGIILVDDSKETEKWNTQIAKVRAIGPLAFHDRDTLKSWPEGAWCQVGDFVRVPKYLQDRWEVDYRESAVLFMIIKDLDLLAKLTGNPLAVKAYV